MATAPAFFTATCPDCETYRTYTLNDADSTRLIGVYNCEACGKRAEIHLDP